VTTDVFTESKVIVLPTVSFVSIEGPEPAILKAPPTTSSVTYEYATQTDNLTIYQRRPQSLLSALARIGGLLGVFKLAWILTCFHTCNFEKMLT
jgi:hypothetical protein